MVERKDPKTGETQIIGVGRLKKMHGTNEAEFAMMISDEYQGRGLGTELLKRLLEVAKDEKLGRITGDILPDNFAMQHVCEKLGFQMKRDPEDPVVRVDLELGVLA